MAKDHGFKDIKKFQVSVRVLMNIMGREEGNTIQISGLFKINIMANYFRQGTSD